MLMTPPYFPIELKQTLETSGFPIPYYAPLVFDCIRVNGDYSGLYDQLSQDQVDSNHPMPLETLISHYDHVAFYLRNHLMFSPHLHRLFTADVIEVHVCPDTNSWMVQFRDDESLVDLGHNFHTQLLHLGIRK